MTTKELLALVAAATPLPWEATHKDNGDHLSLASIGGCGCCGSPWIAVPDAALIVAAVNALPSLCAEVEALRKDAERYRSLKKTGGLAAAMLSAVRPDNWDAAIDDAIDGAKEPK